MKQNQNQNQGKNQPAGKDTGFGGQRPDLNKPTLKDTHNPSRPSHPGQANIGAGKIGGNQNQTPRDRNNNKGGWGQNQGGSTR
jgi:hypothetical protein